MQDMITATKMRVTLPLEIEKQRIAELLCNAFEGGSNYWYSVKDQVAPPTFDFRFDSQQVYPLYDYPLNTGGVIIVQADSDDGAEEINGKTEFRLDLKSITAGLVKMAEEYPASHFTDFLQENDDATTGDVFLQLCLFGEVVFG